MPLKDLLQLIKDGKQLPQTDKIVHIINKMQEAYNLRAGAKLTNSQQLCLL